MKQFKTIHQYNSPNNLNKSPIGEEGPDRAETMEKIFKNLSIGDDGLP